MRKRILAPLAAVLLTATLGSASPAPDPPACVVAARWVGAHRGALPTTLQAFSRYSILYRRAIYDVLPAATRQAMWREHLEGFLRPGQPFTQPQRAAIRQSIEQLPALTAPNADHASAVRLRQHLLTLFDQPTYKRVFGTLGPVPAAAEQNAMRAEAANGRRPLCDCESNDDCGGGTCAFVLCSFTTGCGPFWSYTCTGVCR
jgi:hypothetical protein